MDATFKVSLETKTRMGAGGYLEKYPLIRFSQVYSPTFEPQIFDWETYGIDYGREFEGHSIASAHTMCDP